MLTFGCRKSLEGEEPLALAAAKQYMGGEHNMKLLVTLMRNNVDFDEPNDEGKTANDFPSYRAPAAQTYFSSSMTKTGSDKIQWQPQDQNQKGFSEYPAGRL